MQHAQNDTDHYTVSLPVIVKFLIGARHGVMIGWALEVVDATGAQGVC